MREESENIEENFRAQATENASCRERRANAMQDDPTLQSKTRSDAGNAEAATSREPSASVDSTNPSASEARFATPASGPSPSSAEPPSAVDFPSTNRGWIGEQLVLGESGRAAVVTHVMASYARPLERYLRGSSYRNAGEPHELVQGFLAERLPAPDFFDRWLASGFPLRRWLMNGFLFYLRETVRRAQRLPAGMDAEPADERESAQRTFEREWALELVQRALARARAACERRGQSVHWELFERHHLHSVPYSALIEERGITAKEAATMVRTAAGKLRSAIFDLLDRDGIPESEIDGEILRLMEALRP